MSACVSRRRQQQVTILHMKFVFLRCLLSLKRHVCYTLGDERFRDVADKLSQIVESGSIVADGLEHDGQSGR